MRARELLETTVGDQAALSAQVEAKQVLRQLYQQKVSTFNARLQQLGTTREIW